MRKPHGEFFINYECLIVYYFILLLPYHIMFIKICTFYDNTLRNLSLLLMRSSPILPHILPSIHLKKNDFLLHEDKVVTHEYWVLRGLLKTYLLDANGKEHIVQFAMENWWVTDYQAFFGKKKATLNICCLEDTEILAITYTDKEKLCAELSQFNTFHRQKCNMGYAAQQRRILSLLSDDARTRYEQFVTLYPSLLQRLPKSLIASYLGVSRET